MNDLLILAIKELPSVIDAFRAKHGPTLTDADVTAALYAACASSLAKDHLWLAAHPPT